MNASHSRFGADGTDAATFPTRESAVSGGHTVPATHDPAVVAEPPLSTSAARPEKVRVVTRRCQPEEEPQGRPAPGLVRVAPATAGATGDAPPAGIAYAPPAGLTVMGLIRLYWEHVVVYYRRPDGTESAEVDAVRQAVKPLARLFSNFPAGAIGPRRFKAVRDAMVAQGWCRATVNQQAGRVKRMYKWAVENELVAPGVYHGLQAVTGLKLGRTPAPEGEPVKPVPKELIDATLPRVSAQVAAMIRVQLLTGMRPGEVVIMRTADVADRDGAVWAYKPTHHKTAHHGQKRTVFIGPQAQAVIKPYLDDAAPERFLFSAADADRARRAKQHAERTTPKGEGNRPGTNRKRRPTRKPGDRYRTDSYRHAISAGCAAAFPVPPGVTGVDAERWRKQHHWHPHQLRHNAATELRKAFGIDVAQTILGHRSLQVTEVYAERDMAAAARVMGEVG